MSRHKLIRINYGINRRISFGIAHINHWMRIKGVWLDTPTHDKIIKIIRRRHPDWLITGYALARKKK